MCGRDHLRAIRVEEFSPEVRAALASQSMTASSTIPAQRGSVPELFERANLLNAVVHLSHYCLSRRSQPLMRGREKGRIAARPRRRRLPTRRSALKFVAATVGPQYCMPSDGGHIAGERHERKAWAPSASAANDRLKATEVVTRSPVIRRSRAAPSGRTKLLRLPRRARTALAASGRCRVAGAALTFLALAGYACGVFTPGPTPSSRARGQCRQARAADARGRGPSGPVVDQKPLGELAARLGKLEETFRRIDTLEARVAKAETAASHPASGDPACSTAWQP